MRFLLLLFPTLLLAQSPKAPVGKPTFEGLASDMYDPMPYANSISVNDFKMRMNILASDSLRGRETGDIGQVRAGNYIAREFGKMGLVRKGDDNSFHQYFTLSKSRFEGAKVKLGSRDMDLMTDWYAVPAATPSKKVACKKVTLMPKSGYTNYKVENRIILSWKNADSEQLIEFARSGKAKALVLIDENFESTVRENRRAIQGYGWASVPKMAKNQRELPILYISENAARYWLVNDNYIAQKHAFDAGTLKPTRLKKKVKCDFQKNETLLNGSNVLGYLEGSDERLKHEIVVITAHYDHLGEAGGVIYYGADDNASGTTGVLEIAEAFSKAAAEGNTPKRSLVFMLVSGEEKGLLGSKYYVENPIFPLRNTITNLNTDMIGRVDDEHQGNPDYIYVIGANRLSQELHDVNEAVNAKYMQMEMDYRYNAPDDPNHFYERSDHYNFAKNGIPCIFYFNGVHKDYHKPSDTLEKINFEAATKRTQLTFFVAWELANRASRPKVDK